MLPIVAGVTALAAALVRQWRVVGFLVFALALEAGVYRATTLAVHRERPDVHRLEGLPADASYYSGHTAASIAVYCGIALLADLTDPEPRRAGRDLGGCDRDSDLRRVGAHVPRHAPSARRRRRRPRRRRRRRRDGARLPRRRPRGRRAGGALTQVPKVAVVAHAGKTFGGGLLELRHVLEEEGIADPLWVEVPKSRKAPEAGQARAEGRRRAALRLGRRRHRAAVPRHGRGDEGARRDRAGRDGEPVRDEPRHPAGHPAGRRDRPARRAAPPRRGPLQRRALRRHGRRRLRRGDDPRRRRRAQGSPRPGRLRLDRVEEPAREAVQGEDLGRRRELVRRQGELHPRRQRRTAVRAASRRSRTRAPRTASSSSGS